MSKRLEKQKQSISQKIKKLRIDAGYTSYEKFALEHKLGRKQYWRIEENDTNMTLRTLLRILEIHKISLKEFFKDL